jgi:DNA polymerase-3 subunit epsilon
VWLTLTTEKYPRLSIVRHGNLTDSRRVTIGPFPGAQAAKQAVDGLHEVFPVRQCTSRITAARSGAACILADMGKCSAPCVRPDVDSVYNEAVTDLGAAMLGAGGVVSPLERRMAALSDEHRYEDAAVLRDRLLSVTRGVSRAALLRSLRLIPEITAAAPRRGGGWDIHIVRHGWLAASATCDTAGQVLATAAAEAATAATYPGGTVLVAESELVIDWLRTPGARLIHVTEGHSWHVPVAARPYSPASAVDTRAIASSTEAAEPSSMDANATGSAARTRDTNDS